MRENNREVRSTSVAKSTTSILNSVLAYNEASPNDSILFIDSKGSFAFSQTTGTSSPSIR